MSIISHVESSLLGVGTTCNRRQHDRSDRVWELDLRGVGRSPGLEKMTIFRSIQPCARTGGVGNNTVSYSPLGIPTLVSHHLLFLQPRGNTQLTGRDEPTAPLLFGASSLPSTQTGNPSSVAMGKSAKVAKVRRRTCCTQHFDHILRSPLPMCLLDAADAWLFRPKEDFEWQGSLSASQQKGRSAEVAKGQKECPACKKPA